MVTDFVIAVKSRFINNYPEFYCSIIDDLFENVIDLQQHVSIEFDCKTLPHNMLQVSTAGLTKDQKILAHILYCSKLLLESAREAQFAEFACKLIIKLL